MTYRYIVYLSCSLEPCCPHCGSLLDELADYIEVCKPGVSIKQDSEGYCRDWKEKKHKTVACRDCQRLLVIGADELGAPYIAAGRSQTDIRYLEMMGQ